MGVYNEQGLAGVCVEKMKKTNLVLSTLSLLCCGSRNDFIPVHS
jgi:hypothetical protein